MLNQKKLKSDWNTLIIVKDRNYISNEPQAFKKEIEETQKSFENLNKLVKLK